VFSVIGGLFGTAVLIVAAPALAEVALKFSSFEYFWLVMLGLISAVFLALGNPLKGVVSLLLGLLVASVGLDNPAGYPRFTFGNAELAGGLTLIPIMIGMFAVSEILRSVAAIDRPGRWRRRRSATCSAACGRSPSDTRRRSCAAACSAPRSARCPAPAPTSPRGCATRCPRSSPRSARNSAPATSRHHRGGRLEQQRARRRLDPGAGVRHPGDSITAIVIGVLYIKGLNPGPTIFMNNAPAIYAIFIVFILANLLMIPLGIAAIKARSRCCARRARCCCR
jgi:TctA family transporter